MSENFSSVWNVKRNVWYSSQLNNDNECSPQQNLYVSTLKSLCTPAVENDPVSLIWSGLWLLLVLHTGPEVAGQKTEQGTSDRVRKTMDNRAEAEPLTAAHILQGTQPGSITQAPNSANVCTHATSTERVGDSFSINPATLQLWLSDWLKTSPNVHGWLEYGRWLMDTVVFAWQTVGM